MGPTDHADPEPVTVETSDPRPRGAVRLKRLQHGYTWELTVHAQSDDPGDTWSALALACDMDNTLNRRYYPAQETQ